MYEAFPRSDYYEGSVTMSDFQRLNLIADLCRHSDLGNPHLPCNDKALSDCRIWFPSFICFLQLRCGQFLLRLRIFGSRVPQYDEYQLSYVIVPT